MGTLITAFADKDRQYREAIEAINKMQDQLDKLDNEWSDVLMTAEQTEGL